MKTWVATLGIVLLLLSSARTEPDPTDDPKWDGPALAAHFRSLQPSENSEITAALRIKPGHGQPVEEIPVTCRVAVRPDGWDSIYETGPGRSRGPEKLVIKHFTNAPTAYFYAAAALGSPAPEPQRLAPDKIRAPLAGSDFSLDELGLEFLAWPVQNRLKGEMRLGEPCYVLESADSEGWKVKSWIDKESVTQDGPGLLVAESYNPKNELVKEFTLGGSSFKKINGRWQLQQMRIRSLKRGSETILRFNLPDEALPAAK